MNPTPASPVLPAPDLMATPGATATTPNPFAPRAPQAQSPSPGDLRYLPRLIALACLALLAVFLLAGCVFPHGRQDRSSSIVAYLYPRQAQPLPPTNIPTLRLPLRVGIAFVPSERIGGRGVTEFQKNAVLQRVAAEFRGRDYIESIEIVPSTYLRPGGGFPNLEQARRLLNFDVVALVAYDQVQFTEGNLLSLSYWTIVGAYIFRGNHNDTQTLMEASVYDIPSRNLLFRAPGASQVQANSAAAYADANLRADSAKSFDLATNDLIANLKVQLEDFRTRVKSATGNVANIEHKPGYTGAGSMEGGFVLALAALAGVGIWRRHGQTS